jgi:hypothetical protein
MFSLLLRCMLRAPDSSYRLSLTSLRKSDWLLAVMDLLAVSPFWSHALSKMPYSILRHIISCIACITIVVQLSNLYPAILVVPHAIQHDVVLRDRRSFKECWCELLAGAYHDQWSWPVIMMRTSISDLVTYITIVRSLAVAPTRYSFISHGFCYYRATLIYSSSSSPALWLLIFDCGKVIVGSGGLFMHFYARRAVGRHTLPVEFSTWATAVLMITNHSSSW